MASGKTHHTTEGDTALEVPACMHFYADMLHFFLVLLHFDFFSAEVLHLYCAVLVILKCLVSDVFIITLPCVIFRKLLFNLVYIYVNKNPHRGYGIPALLRNSPSENRLL